MAFMLDQAPYSAPQGPSSAAGGPKRKVPRLAHLGDILMIAAAVGLVAFIVALVMAILTSSSG
jgi:hypothetical protein